MVSPANVSLLTPSGVARTVTLSTSIEEEAGSQVFQATLGPEATPILVKLMSSHDGAASLRREATVLRAANLNGILQAPLYYGSADEPYPFIACEAIEGRTLEDETLTVHPGGWPLLDAFGFIHELLAFSSALSRTGFIHLGLHPGSIFLPQDGGSLKIASWSNATLSGTLQAIDVVLPGRRAFQGGLITATKPVHPSGYEIKTRCLNDSFDLYSIGMTFVSLLVGKELFDKEAELNSTQWRDLLIEGRRDLFEIATLDSSLGEVLMRFLNRLIVDRREFRRDVRWLSPFENSTSALLAFDRLCQRILDEVSELENMELGECDGFRSRLLGYHRREEIARIRPDKVVYRLPRTKGWDFD